MKNVISFSLFGREESYIKGALANSVLAKEIFPDWVTRYYVDDTIPWEVISELSNTGSEIILKPKSIGFSGSLWRFEVAYDPDVQFYIVRDTDDRLCSRQKEAVDEWLRSNKNFHIMRDHPNHKHEMMAGMWGGVSGAVKEFETLYKAYVSQGKYDFWSDTIFLKNFIWDKYAKFDHVAHDEYWRPLGSEMKFSMPLEHPGRFVGNKYGSNGDPVYDLINDDQDNSGVLVCKSLDITNNDVAKHIVDLPFKNVYLLANILDVDAAVSLYKDNPKVHVIKVASKKEFFDIISKYSKSKIVQINNSMECV